MRTDELLELSIEKMAFGGRGLARHEGRVVFVSDVLPGERVTAKVRKIWKDFAECRPVDILEPSPDRVTPSCPLVAECGGCQWMHAAYPAQLRLKAEVLADTLVRLGGITEPRVMPVIPSEEPSGYRRRGQFKAGIVKESPVVGFYREQSHDLVDIPHCPIFHPALNDVLAALREVITTEPAWASAIAEGRICTGFPASKTFLLLMPREHKRVDTERLFPLLQARAPHMIGLAVSKNGRIVSRIGENTLDFELPFSPHPLPLTPHLHLIVRDAGFFQANWPASRHLVATALDFLDPAPSNTVLDLYAGVGNFALAFSSGAGKVIGVEESPVSTKCAAENANLNGISNFEIITASSERGLEQIDRADLVHLDPPRQGASEKVLQGIVRLKPRKVVYTSCNPSTLARDLKFLVANGYRVGIIQPVDMFPQTYHIETVVELNLA